MPGGSCVRRRHALGDERVDVTAAEVLGNIEAMASGIEAITAGSSVTVELLLDIHRRLLAGTRLAGHGGRLREEQNWIGGSDNFYNIRVYVNGRLFGGPPTEYHKGVFHTSIPAYVAQPGAIITITFTYRYGCFLFFTCTAHNVPNQYHVPYR